MASASGSYLMRIARFWAPLIDTCATPLRPGEPRRDHRLGELVHRLRLGGLRGERQEDDRLVGRVDLAVARQRGGFRQPAGGGGERRLDVLGGGVDIARGSNSSVIEVEPWLDDEVIEARPAMVESCRSIGAATDTAIDSGEAPAIDAETLMVGTSIRGSAASGRVR